MTVFRGGDTTNAIAGEIGATAQDLLDLILTVDGAGSTLDADTVDGEQAETFAYRANNLSDLGSASTAFDNIKQDASETATGVVEKATTTEAQNGTEADKYPDVVGVKAHWDQRAASQEDITGSWTFDPEHATDSGTDAFVSATNTAVPADGVTITRDFQSANTTTTPTLDGKTITTRDGSALWADALSGPHKLEYESGTDTYLALNPNPVSANSANAPVSRDSAGRFKATNPTSAQDVATLNWVALDAVSTSSDPALAFDTWRTPNNNRAVVVVVQVLVETNGSVNGIVFLDVDESGGTTADYSLEAHSDEINGSGAENYETLTTIIPPGGSYRINNSSDPNTANAIEVHRELPLWV